MNRFYPALSSGNAKSERGEKLFPNLCNLNLKIWKSFIQGATRHKEEFINFKKNCNSIRGRVLCKYKIIGHKMYNHKRICRSMQAMKAFWGNGMD